MADPRSIAFKALKRVSEEEAYSSLVLDSILDHSGLDERDKGFVSMLFYGVLENQLRLDYIIDSLRKGSGRLENVVRLILRMGLYQLSFMDKVPDSAAVNESVKLARQCGLDRASGFINGILRAYIRSGKEEHLPERSDDEQLYLSLRYSCPLWIVRKWTEEYGEDICEKTLECLSGRPSIYVRVNNTASSTVEVMKMLSEQNVSAYEVKWLDNALSVSSTGSIEKLEAYRKGFIHVQDISSQLCCRVLDSQEGETVLDVCAAPGGKSFTTAERMNGRGSVVSCDIYSQRTALIAEGAERLKLGCIKAQVRDALRGEAIEADRVLCDVPCSGLGIIRRKPDIRSKNAETIAQLPEMQYDILCRSAGCVRSGGVLVYSTCTLSRAENSDIIERFLHEHQDFEPYGLVLPDEALRTIDEPEHMLTLFPFAADSDGFFIARMKRKG